MVENCRLCPEAGRMRRRRLHATTNVKTTPGDLGTANRQASTKVVRTAPPPVDDKIFLEPPPPGAVKTTRRNATTHAHTTNRASSSLPRRATCQAAFTIRGPPKNSASSNLPWPNQILRRVRAEPSRRPPRHRRRRLFGAPTHWLISTQPTAARRVGRSLVWLAKVSSTLRPRNAARFRLSR